MATPAAAPAATASSGSPDIRFAELTARLRADNLRVAERMQKIETAAPAAAPAPSRATAEQIDRAALAAIAEAVSPAPPAAPAAGSYGDVRIRAIQPTPS